MDDAKVVRGNFTRATSTTTTKSPMPPADGLSWTTVRFCADLATEARLMEGISELLQREGVSAVVTQALETELNFADGGGSTAA